MIAWVNGIPCAAVLIQLGRSSSGTLAPVKISRKPKITFESTAFSRIRRLAAALTSPRPVQEKAAIRTTNPSGASELAGRWTPRTSAPTSSENAATKAPFSRTGNERPKKSGIRGAGLTRIALSVFW